MISRKIVGSVKWNDPRLTDFDRLLWVLLTISADDFGRLEGEPVSIKLNCLPGLDHSVGDITDSLTRLHTVGLVINYEVDGNIFIQIEKWDCHQRFHGINKHPSTFPLPESMRDYE